MSSPDPVLGVHVAVNRSLPARAGGTGQDPFLPGQAIDLAAIRPEEICQASVRQTWIRGHFA